MAAPQKFNVELQHAPEFPLLDMYQKEMKAGTDTNVQLFAATLLTLATGGKQPKCLLTDE